MFKNYLMLFAVASLTLITSCAVSVKEHNPTDKVLYDEKYSYTDLQILSDEMTKSLLTQPVIASREDQPVIIVYGISNRTTEHIDTKGLTDTIRTKLIKSNKFKFINEDQRENIEKELAYQYNSGNTDPNLRIEKAKQVGAEYMLTGRLMAIEKEQPKQMRLKKKNLIYYKLTMELTDLKTSLIAWTEEYEIVREASKPFIGW